MYRSRRLSRLLYRAFRLTAAVITILMLLFLTLRHSHGISHQSPHLLPHNPIHDVTTRVHDITTQVQEVTARTPEVTTNRDPVDAIPELMDGGVNMPEVLYRSILALRAVYKSNNTRINLVDEQSTCHTVTQCKALGFLYQGFGDVTLDLALYQYHLSFLRQRLLASSPRPRRCTGCFRYNFKTLISPKSMCQGKRPIHLVILITTIPGELAERQALRETWLRRARNNTGDVRYAFLLGDGWARKESRELRTESRRYRDILQEDYKDSYYNLSYKVVSGFLWAVNHCRRASFVVRTAGDNYLHLPRIIKYLDDQRRSGTGFDKVQVGRCVGRTRVNRNLWWRHYQTLNDYPEDRYMPYCIGTTFIFDMPTTRRILKAVSDVPFFNIEDIWLGLVMEQAGVRVRDVRAFNVQYYPGTDVSRYQGWRKKVGMCNFTRNMFSLHRVTPEDIRNIHKACIVGEGSDGQR